MSRSMPAPALLLLLTTAVLRGQAPAPPSGTSLEVQVAHPMSFGGLLVGAAGGRITLTEDGVLVPDGPGVLPGSLPPAREARFVLTGPPLAAFSISVLPAAPILTGPKGGILRMSELRCSLPNLQGSFDAAGRAELRLGGRLDIPANAGPGPYVSGPLSIQLRVPSAPGERTFQRTFVISAFLRAPLLLSNTGPMDFGSLLPGSQAGTFEVLADGGHRSATPGGPSLVSGSPRPATFTIQGPEGTCYHIQLPDRILLAGPGAPIPVEAFTCSTPLAGSMPTGGVNFGVGARLLVQRDQTPGAYRGIFLVAVIYQ